MTNDDGRRKAWQSMIDELSFEEAFDQLQKTIAQLEEEDLPLDKALSLFERGTMLAQHCETLLDQAELRVKQLVPAEEADGHDTVPFDAL